MGAVKQWQLEQAEKEMAPDCPRCGVSPYDDGSFYDEDRHICVTEDELDDQEPDWDEHPGPYCTYGEEDGDWEED